MFVMFYKHLKKYIYQNIFVHKINFKLLAFHIIIMFRLLAFHTCKVEL